MFMRRVVILALVLSLLSGCKFSDLFFDLKLKLRGGKFSTKNVTLETDQGKIPLKVEVADSKRERELGLMHREKLEEGHGMLFIFEDEALRNFWMKNTLVPLDIIFFNSQKKAVSFAENMEPCKVAACPSYGSGEPARYALEVPAGFVKNHVVSVGDTIKDKE
jgi:uncharacterized membrane protein (UPF0127 family)